jgi:hypothetical protein
MTSAWFKAGIRVTFCTGRDSRGNKTFMTGIQSVLDHSTTFWPGTTHQLSGEARAEVGRHGYHACDSLAEVFFGGEAPYAVGAPVTGRDKVSYPIGTLVAVAEVELGADAVKREGVWASTWMRVVRIVPDADVRRAFDTPATISRWGVALVRVVQGMLHGDAEDEEPAAVFPSGETWWVRHGCVVLIRRWAVGPGWAGWALFGPNPDRTTDPFSPVWVELRRLAAAA